MSWLLIVVPVWASVSVLLAVCIGRGVRLADDRDMAVPSSAVSGFMPEGWSTSTAQPR